MNEAWSVAVGPFAVAAFALLVPGLIVVAAGWGTRRLAVYFFAPAVSLAVIAVAAIAAPVVRLPWSALPIAIVTAVTATVAWLLRRWADAQATLPRPPAGAAIASIVGGIAASLIIGLQLAVVFDSPTNISQTFDAIVHLNTVAYAVDTGNASAFHIGNTSDIPFYPNGWHALASLAAVTSNVSVPVAVTAANMALAAVAWPASCIALGLTLLGSRKAVALATAALSTAFGAFPMLLLYFGVLYPNMTAYAVLPAGIAAVWMICRPAHSRDRVRSLVLLLVISGGLGLAHPNAFFALFAFGAALSLVELLRVALTRHDRRTWITNSAVAAVLLLIGALLWRFGRTNWEMSRWGPWETTAQAFGEGILLSPREFSVTLVTAALIIYGLIAVVRRPRLLPAAVPYAVAVFMFVLVAGTPAENLLREMVTNPWYNDSFRLAALLPVAGIPIAALGAVTLFDDASGWSRRLRVPRRAVQVTAFVAAGALFLVGAGANVRSTADTAQSAYALNEKSALLTTDEYALLERLDDTTPADALILGNPWTGASLAYAIGGRDVVETHIFGVRTDAESYLDEHLADIDSDPAVCEAIAEIGAGYVLDFGTDNVFRDPARDTVHDGYAELAPSTHLVVADEQGDARLLRIEGCG